MTIVNYVTHVQMQTRQLEQKAERARRGTGLRIGAFLRRRMRSKIRRSKRSAQPGKPPRAHSSHNFASLKNIRFALGPGAASVVVGPLQFAGRQPLGPTGGSLMEFGGRPAIRERRVGRGWRPLGHKRRRPGQPIRRRRVKYDPHPFVGPSLEEELAAGTIPKAYAASYARS